MIYTVTLNPAIDYVITLPDFKAGEVNRTSSEEFFCGGKGINVSLVLKQLGINSKALGFVAGFTGNAIEQNLKEKGIDTDLIYVRNGFSRINVKIKEKTESEINGQGPVIEESDVDLLIKKLNALTGGDILVLAGSVPVSIGKDIYEKILSHLSGKGIRFVIDTSGSLLTRTLKYGPFLIKPNHIELSEIFNTKITDLAQTVQYAEILQKQGAKNVLVSMAEKGAILLDGNGNLHNIQAPCGKVINSVGAGDSMIAGFLAGYLEKGDYDLALSMGIAAGSATAFSKDLADREAILDLFSKIRN